MTLLQTAQLRLHETSHHHNVIYFFFAFLEAVAFLASFFLIGLSVLFGASNASKFKISSSFVLSASNCSLYTSVVLALLLPACEYESTFLRSPPAAPLSKHSLQYVFLPSLGINGTSHFLPQLSHVAEYMRLSSE